MRGKWESSLTSRAVWGGGAAEKFYAPPAMAGQLLGMESHVLMQGGATPEGGEEGGWAHVPAFDRTNQRMLTLRICVPLGRTVCGGWGYRS